MPFFGEQMFALAAAKLLHKSHFISTPKAIKEHPKRRSFTMSDVKIFASGKPKNAMLAVLQEVSKVLDSQDVWEKIPKKILQGCKGVAIISTMEFGFMISGGGGDGVVMKKNEEDGGSITWGPPAAISMNFVGAGFNFGMAEKYVLLFPMTEKGLEELTDDTFKSGIQAGVAAGPVGREAELGVLTGKKGVRATYSYIVEKGAIVTAGLSGALMKQAESANAEFYGTDATPSDIVMKPGTVTIPEGKGVEKVHEKLTALTTK